MSKENEKQQIVKHCVYCGTRIEENKIYCPKCGNILISRVHFFVLANNIVGGRCKFCGHKIPGIWRDVDSTRSSD